MRVEHIGSVAVVILDHPPVNALSRAVRQALLTAVEGLDRDSAVSAIVLHGATLGGGAETALACHYRCAAADLQLGFPEVNLGLIPGSGGTVRLPRVVGVAVALDLMIRGAPIGAAAATREWFREFRTGLPAARRGSAAAERIVQCVEVAVVQPFTAALAFTRELFEQCRVSAESRALVGLEHVLAVIGRLRQEHGDRYWTTAPLLERLERDGRRLADWS